MNQLKIFTGKTGGALKVVVYGPEGIGKSTLAAHFPRPVFIDTEGSTRHMDVARTEKPTSWAMLMEQVEYVRNDPGVCSSLIIDTADWAEQLCMDGICAIKKLTGIDPCRRIAYTIVNKLTKTVFGEYAAEGGDEFAQSVLTAMDSVKKKAMQLALVGGEAWLKPVPGKDGFAFSVVSRDHVLVFGRDGNGVPTDIGTAEYAAEGGYLYTLLERRTVNGAGQLTLRNRLYRSAMQNDLGQPVPLAALEQYAALPDEYTFPKPLGGLGLARLKTPLENCVDGSPDGVSVYAPAVGLIRNIDHNEALLNGEFDLGRFRMFASSDLLRRGGDGRPRLEDKLFVGIDDDPESVKLTAFSPELRVDQFHAREQSYLRAAESIIGLKRGLLSEVEEAERTAKEITSSAGDYNLSIIDFQQMWETAAKEAVRLCGVLGRMYHVPGAHDAAGDAVSIDWGNGILYDEDKTWADYLDMVARGLLKPEIALGWRFGMPTETEQDLAAIRAKYMPATVQMADGDE